MASEDSSLPHAEWNPALEAVVKREAEEAEALHWLHHHASLWAARRNDGLQIPAIVIASATGFASATADVPPVAIGVLSLLVGTLGTLNSYFKFSQRAEGHRIISQMYLKTFKHIQTELALPIEQRQAADKLLGDLREKLARISETAPVLPEAVIAAFKKRFREVETAVPIVANGLHPVEIYVAPTVMRVESLPPTPRAQRPIVRLEV